MLLFVVGYVEAETVNVSARWLADGGLGYIILSLISEKEYGSSEVTKVCMDPVFTGLHQVPASLLIGGQDL